MKQAGTIEGIYRYPVKSMLGEELDSARIDEHGIEADRRWAVRDEGRGDFSTGKRQGALMGFRARLPGSGDASQAPEIALPDGSVFFADDESASDRLSRALGCPVSLWQLDPAAPPPGPEVPEPDFDAEADMRAVMAREPGEPMPDFSDFPATLGAYMGRRDRPFVDLSPLMLMSVESLATIQRAAPSSRIDVRRFRPSLLVSAPAAGDFPEQDWIGRRARVGETILSIQLACPRCVMTTHGFSDLPRDSTIMRKLVSEAEGNLGVYATVERAGDVRVGDAIELLD